jgi:hypothetical protein
MPSRDPALPSVFERNVLQLLADQDWRSLAQLGYPSPATLQKLVSKKWIESRGLFAEFRITQLGAEALRAKFRNSDRSLISRMSC